MIASSNGAREKQVPIDDQPKSFQRHQLMMTLKNAYVARMPRTKHRAIVFVSALVSGTLVMMAAANSPDAQTRTTTHDGIPLDLSIGIRLAGTLLRVPAGYLAPWPPLSKRDGVTDTDRIAFNFWMPSRRYVEINSTSIVGSRPQEKGRPPPPPEAYVVNVRDFGLRARDELSHRSPDNKMENLIKLYGQEAYSFQQEDFGLVRFWRRDWPYPNPEPFLHYRHVEGSDPQVFFRCNPPHRSPPNPLCDGDVYFSGERLSFYVVFPRDQLLNWRNSLVATRDLFNSWKVTQ